MTVDLKLSDISQNAIANSVVKRALDRKADSILLNTKLDYKTFEVHKDDSSIHVTKEEKLKWNKATETYVDKKLSEASDNAISNKEVYLALTKKADKQETKKHLESNDIHVSLEEKESWTNKVVKSELLENEFRENFSQLTDDVMNYDLLLLNFRCCDELSSKLIQTSYLKDGKYTTLSIAGFTCGVIFNLDKPQSIAIANSNGPIYITGLLGIKIN